MNRTAKTVPPVVTPGYQLAPGGVIHRSATRNHDLL